MEQINGFNISSHNNFEVDRKPHRVVYSTKLRSGTTVEICGNRKSVFKHDGLIKYEIDHFTKPFSDTISGIRIRKFVRQSPTTYTLDEYVPTPKSMLKKILSKILPENIKEAVFKKTIKGKWVQRL